jgi:phage terminase large subunit-like protein
MPATKKIPRRAKPSRTSKPPVSSTPHVDAALRYCRQVLDGTVLAGKWVKKACQRHLDDLERAKTDTFGFYFDPAQAERVCRFLEMLPHVKGKWARPDPLNPGANCLRLEDWQCFATCAVFGWLVKGSERVVRGGRKVGLRRFKETDIWVARKNAKSTLAAGWGHWMFAKDDEPGAEVYCGAGSEKQAWEVFGPARQMCIAEPKMQNELGIEVNARNLTLSSGGALSKFEPVIGKPGDGSSPHCAIIDEYHEHQTSEQFDTFKTGMGAREQPLLLVISTGGFNLAGPARDRWVEGEKILDRVFEDERRFVLIYTVDKDSEWSTEAGLRKANPNWGVSVNVETVIADLANALREARNQTAFKTKHANLWVSASTAFFNLEFWSRCEDRTIKVENYAGMRCVEAGDLASKIDLVAAVKVFPVDSKFVIFARYYSPEDVVNLPENQHYQKWRAEGWLTATPGNIVDLQRFRDDLIEDCSRFQMLEIPLDPWQATLMINELREKNAPAYELRQIVQNLSEPMKNVDALMRAGRLIHDGNPITTWCLSNVVAQVDRKDNIFPRKERPENKIDGAVALIMAMGRAFLLAGQGLASAGVVFAEI